MKLFVVFLACLCLKETTAFFSAKVSGVNLEADFKISATNISSNINATLKSLTELTAAIQAQIVIPPTDALLVRANVDILFSYFKLMGMFVGDFLKYTADTTYTVPRIFAKFNEDSGVFFFYLTGLMPETAGAALDTAFTTKLQASLAAINAAMILMGNQLSVFYETFYNFQGTLIPLTPAIVNDAFVSENIANIKNAISAIDFNTALIRQQIAGLLLTILGENALIVALQKPMSQYGVSLINGTADILKELKKQSLLISKYELAAVAQVQATQKAFVTKFQTSYADTIVAPIIQITVQTCDNYTRYIIANLDYLSDEFAQWGYDSLDPNAEEPDFVLYAYYQLTSITEAATQFQNYLLNALRENTAAARACVAKFTPQAVSILSTTNTQYAACTKIAIEFIGSEEKSAENNVNAVRTKTINYLNSMMACLTPASGSKEDRAVIVNCILTLNIAITKDVNTGVGTPKYTDDASYKYGQDFRQASAAYLTCLTTAAAVQSRSITSFQTAFERC